MEELKKTLNTSNTEVCILSMQCLDRLCQLSSGLLSENMVITLIRNILNAPTPVEMRSACYNLLSTVTKDMFSSSSITRNKYLTVVVSELLKNLKPDDVAIQAMKKDNTISCHLQWLVQQKSRLHVLSKLMKENLAERCLDLFTGNSVCYPLIAEVITGLQIDKSVLVMLLNRQKPDVINHALKSLKPFITSQDLIGSPSYGPMNSSPTPLSSPYKSPLSPSSSLSCAFTFDDISSDRSYATEFTPRKSINPNLYGRVRTTDDKMNGKEVLKPIHSDE